MKASILGAIELLFESVFTARLLVDAESYGSTESRTEIPVPFDVVVDEDVVGLEVGISVMARHALLFYRTYS